MTADPKILDEDGHIVISKAIGENYDEEWNCHSTYRVIKGAKGSKKSKFLAQWYMYHLERFPLANLLVVRKVFTSIKDSVYTELKWAINRFGIDDKWVCKTSPMEIINIRTGQKILFKGLDKAEKMASVTVDTGHLCWVWVEEAFEIEDEGEFDKLSMSIRGEPPPGLWIQFTLSFNPWSDRTWIKSRFFDNPDSMTSVFTKTFRDNEFLSDVDIQRYMDMYERNPRAARVFCDGEWGVSEGLVYENWFVEDFDVDTILANPDVKTAYGLDFGYKTSYNAFVALAVDQKTKTIYVFDEMYAKGIFNDEIARKIIEMGYGKEEIWADSAEQKSIAELQRGYLFQEELPPIEGEDEPIVRTFRRSLPNIHSAYKGPDSVRNGIQRVQMYKIIILPKCDNFIAEISSYCYAKDRTGELTGEPEKRMDHLMDALRYAMEQFFVKGSGSVTEVTGESRPRAIDAPAVKRSRRVFST